MLQIVCHEKAVDYIMPRIADGATKPLWEVYGLHNVFLSSADIIGLTHLSCAFLRKGACRFLLDNRVIKKSERHSASAPSYRRFWLYHIWCFMPDAPWSGQGVCLKQTWILSPSYCWLLGIIFGCLILRNLRGNMEMFSICLHQLFA